MASSKEYLTFILDQLSSLSGVTYKAMMGEYILCYQGRIIGGIYDDRFLVKPTDSARRLLPDAPEELPYERAKPMLLVEEVDDREFLTRLLNEVAGELPAPGKRKTAANNKAQIQRITNYEALFDELSSALSDPENAVREIKSIQAKASKLEKYYTGKLWKKDFSDDEAGKLPAGLKRGVLSEDGIFSLLDEIKALTETEGR